MTAEFRKLDGRSAFAVSSIDGRPAVGEELCELELVSRGSEVERRLSSAIRGVHVSAGNNERLANKRPEKGTRGVVLGRLGVGFRPSGT